MHMKLSSYDDEMKKKIVYKKKNDIKATKANDLHRIHE